MKPTRESVVQLFGDKVQCYDATEIPGEDAQGIWLIDDAQYFADTTRLSHSAIKTWRRSIREYFARYVAKTLPDRDSADLIYGRMLHTAVLELQELANRYSFLDRKLDLRKTDDKAYKAVWDAANIGKTTVERDDWYLAKESSLTIAESPLASQIMSDPGLCEVVLVWRDITTGMCLRAKLDKVVPQRYGQPLRIWDLKSTRDPSPEEFSRDAGNYRYHCQMDFYSRGAEQVFQVGTSEFLFLAVGKTSPIEIGVYECGQREWQAARRDNDQDLLGIQNAHDFDQWHGRYSQKLTPLNLAPWHLKDRNEK